MPAGSILGGCLLGAGLLTIFLWGAGRWVSNVNAGLDTAFPITSAHAHNSEQHSGLSGALDQGFCSIEVDVFAVGRTCMVGHNSGDLSSDQTLQALYLDPLLEVVRANRGRVYPQSRYLGSCASVTLLVDVKETPQQAPERSFDIIHSILQSYAEEEPGFLASWDGPQNQPSGLGAVTVMISGDRPSPQHMLSQYQRRYAILDGREPDLDADLPVSLVPVISKAWHGGSQPVVRGLDSLHPAAAELAAAQRLIRRAHGQGRRIRFWGTLDTPQQWQDLLDMGVDLISTDDVAALRAFVMSRAAAVAPRRPMVQWRNHNRSVARRRTLQTPRGT